MSVRLRIALITCMAGVLAALPPAVGWQQWYDDNNKVILYRPADDGITRPAPGISPKPLYINYDVSNAPAGVANEILQAMSTWNSVAGATISLKDSGETACCPDGSECLCKDGVNTISWVSRNWIWQSNVLAITYPEDWDPTTGVVRETDMMINGVNFRWSIGRAPRDNEYDLLSVITHELGHFCMLDDLFDYRFSQSTMFAYISVGSMRPRTLAPDDMDGLRFMYPATADDIPPPRVTGFIKQGETISHDKLIETESIVLDNVAVNGFGFATAPLKLEVWQSDALVASPEVMLAQFVGYNELKINVTFSGAPGGYDLKVINPNTKCDLVEEALQVNSTDNTAPVVHAEDDSTVYVGHAKTVCATADDPEGDGDGDAPLTYSWELVVQPEGSTATLADSDTECATFTADKKGYYYLEVTASDGIVTSYADATLVTANVKSGGTGGNGGGSGGGCRLQVASSSSSAGENFSADLLILILPPFVIVTIKRLSLKRKGK